MSKPSAQWFEEDRFWRTFAGWMFTPERLAATPVEINQIIQLMELPAQARILDLCCGPGRHALELARRGYRVVGVDRNRAFLDQADRQARREKLAVKFVNEDMRRFRSRGHFDAAINLFTSFGYFPDPDDDRRVLVNLHRSLRPGARLLLDVKGKEVIARQFRPRDWHERDGTIMLEERKVSQDWGWMDARWILIKGARRVEYTVSHRMYSAKELTDLLHACGFRAARVYGSFSGDAYGPEAGRLVVLATK